MASPLPRVQSELHLSANQPGMKHVKHVNHYASYLLKPHHMDIKLLVEPPFLVDHVGAEIRFRFRNLILAAMPSARF